MEANFNRPLLLLILLILVSISTARDTITPSTPLADTETLISANSKFALGFFTPASSFSRYIGLWYNQIDEPDHSILWVANRQDPLLNSTGVLSVMPDGRLTITAPNMSAVWYSAISTIKLTNPVAQLLDNGNLVVKEDGDDNTNYGWQGFNYLTDTLIPGMRLGLDKTQRLNMTLVAWASSTDPSPGIYQAFINTHGDPEMYFSQGSTLLWRSGPWVGTHFSGIPEMTHQKFSNLSFQNNDQEVTYSYSVNNLTPVPRFYIDRTGYLERTHWIPERNRWDYFWIGPKDLCDRFGECGPFGVCDSNALSTCSCLQGFMPKDQANWNLREGHDGCVRVHELDCKNGTDGFNIVSNVKLPQALNCTVDRGMDLAQCAEACKRNCSCIAYASADVRNGGSGCLMWGGDRLFDIQKYVGNGQEVHVRVAAQDVVASPDQSNGGHDSTVVIVVSLVVGGLLLTSAACFLWRRKKKRRVLFNDLLRHNPKNEDLDLPLFDFRTIAAGTDYFSNVNKLGEGGFGPVYKGKLRDGQEIAVKRLAKTSMQGHEEFKNEVMLIAKLQHRNLVRILGCCIQGDERMLVYEYMPNGSLDAFLFAEEKGELVHWKTRYQIIIGIARGLLYLHQDSRFRIIHRDLKASNILLDQELNPKISDFGLARIFGGDETDFNTRKVVGTYGYMSPEYAMDGVFSVKSGVFSFGVLVLEIISGKKNRGAYAIPPNINLVEHAWSLWKEDKSLQLVDDSMSYSFPTDEILRCIKVGLLCVQEHPEDRPLMSSVVPMLGSDLTMLPQPKQPGLAARRGPFEAESSSGNQDSCKVNEMSITLLEPR